MSTLKERKEDFVTGLNGGSILEINLITSVALTAYVCWNLLSIRGNINVFIDFALNWITLLLSITVYSNAISLLQILIVVPCVVLFYISSSKSKSQKTETNSREKQPKPFQLEKKPFITVYRGSMLVLTALAILAVDFQVFPRRFAKVETWGTSLMDLGVGSFVFSNGVVSSRVIIKEKMNPSSRPCMIKRALNALRSGGTLLIIGLLRLYFVKNLEYQEHVTEYGVHWNFFMTLSLLPPVLVLLDPITEWIPRPAIAALISVMYELVLIKGDGFLEFLILAPRRNFIEANREGIVSFLGYCSIFLWGQTTGFYVLGNKPTINNLYRPSVESLQRPSDKRSVTMWNNLSTVSPLWGLFIWTFIHTATAQGILSHDPYYASRRFANLPYVSWVVAYNTGLLFFYCLIDKLFSGTNKGCAVPPSLDALNSNGLVMFLLANLLTGATNMSMSTIDASVGTAMIVLTMYALVIAAISLFLYRNKIFVKL